MRVGSTPSSVSAASAGSPVFSFAFVCTMIGAPVSMLAVAQAARMRWTSPPMPYRSTAHLRNAARTPVSLMPSRISRMKMPASASWSRCLRNIGSSKNV